MAQVELGVGQFAQTVRQVRSLRRPAPIANGWPVPGDRWPAGICRDVPTPCPERTWPAPRPDRWPAACAGSCPTLRGSGARLHRAAPGLMRNTPSATRLSATSGFSAAIDRSAPFQGQTEQPVGPIQFSEMLVEAAQRLIERCLHIRLAIQNASLIDAAIEQRDHTQAIGGPRGLIAEQVEHEALDALGARRLGQRPAAGRRQPHGEESDQAGDEREYAPALRIERGGCGGRTSPAGSARCPAALPAARLSDSGRYRGSAPPPTGICAPGPCAWR